MGEVLKFTVGPRLLQMLGCLMGVFPFARILHGVPRFDYVSLGNLAALLTIVLSSYGVFNGVATGSTTEADWFAAQDGFNVTTVKSTTKILGIFYGYSHYAFTAILAILQLINARGIEDLLRCHLRLAQTADAGTILLNRCREERRRTIFTFIICPTAVFLLIEGVQTTIQFLYQAYTWDFFKYRALSYPAYSAFIIYQFVACWILLPCAPLLRAMKASVQSSASAAENQGHPPTSSPSDKVAWSSEYPKMADRLMTPAEVCRNYRDVLSLCCRFSEFCGSSIAVVHLLCFVDIATVTYLSYLNLLNAETGFAYWNTVYACTSLATGIVVCVVNYMAEEIIREDEDVRNTIRTIGMTSGQRKLFDPDNGKNGAKNRGEERGAAVPTDRTWNVYIIPDTPFDRILAERGVTLTANGFFELRKSTLTWILELILTYTIIVVQFRADEEH